MSCFHKTHKSNALYEGSVIFCPTSQQLLVAQGLLLFIVSSRSHSDTPHSVGLLWTWHQPEAKPLRDNTQHSQEPDILVPAGFEPTIAVSGRPQAHALNRATTGIALRKCNNLYFTQNIIRQPKQERQDGWVV